mmetsp:Transcript_89885/g.179537  ORF Transcript_89885/g.179537 Transcript_89885/m.179537 type:complete len:97 (+) Transcript_89885:375-665(+)
MRWSWVPIASTPLFAITKILSAFRTVERRCATTKVVRFCISVLMAFCTRCSDSASRAEVASSSSSTRGSTNKARAMAMRCFCPPDSRTPLSPTSVL